MDLAIDGDPQAVLRDQAGCGPSRIGWTDEAIYDAVTVCALFNFYVRWVDGCGVHEMSEADHRASGKRLAQFGYAPAKLANGLTTHGGG